MKTLLFRFIRRYKVGRAANKVLKTGLPETVYSYFRGRHLITHLWPNGKIEVHRGFCSCDINFILNMTKRGRYTIAKPINIYRCKKTVYKRV